MATCEVLVKYNNRKQVVKFCRNEEFSDVTILKNEVVKVFKVKGEFVIQMKREDWGGEFGDVMNEDVIAGHLIMRIVRVEDATSCCSASGTTPLDKSNKVCGDIVAILCLYYVCTRLIWSWYLKNSQVFHHQRKRVVVNGNT